MLVIARIVHDVCEASHWIESLNFHSYSARLRFSCFRMRRIPPTRAVDGAVASKEVVSVSTVEEMVSVLQPRLQALESK